MQSNDMTLDVSKAVRLEQPTVIAATLHLPDDLPDTSQSAPLNLIFAVHGGGYRRIYWHPPFADDSYSFAQWFTDRGKAVLAIDMLGMGDSSKPEPESCLSHEIIATAHAEALEQVVEQLAKQSNRKISITGIGHSMGGMMMITQAAKHPRMDRVAILGWANEPMNLGETDVATLQANLIPSGYLSTPREPMRKLFYASDVPPDLISADEAHGSKSPSTMGRNALTPGIVHDDAANIKVPVLVVQSAIDTSPEPEKEPAYFKSAPSVELQIVPNAAHCQNFAGTRAQHWGNLNDWIDRMASSAG